MKQEAVSLQEVELSEDALESQETIDAALEELLMENSSDGVGTLLKESDNKSALVASLNRLPVNNFIALDNGTKTQTHTSASVTVKMTVAVYYDIYVYGLVDHYRITKVIFTPTLLDSTFSLNKITATIGYYGSGFTYSSGTFTAKNYESNTISYSNSSVASGKEYPKSTGFNYFVISADASGGYSDASVNSSLFFKRTSTGVVSEFTLPKVSL